MYEFSGTAKNRLPGSVLLDLTHDRTVLRIILNFAAAWMVTSFLDITVDSFQIQMLLLSWRRMFFTRKPSWQPVSLNKGAF